MEFLLQDDIFLKIVGITVIFLISQLWSWLWHLHDMFESFHNTDDIYKGKSPGRKSLLTEVALEDVENRLRLCPTPVVICPNL